MVEGEVRTRFLKSHARFSPRRKQSMRNKKQRKLVGHVGMCMDTKWGRGLWSFPDYREPPKQSLPQRLRRRRGDPSYSLEATTRAAIGKVAASEQRSVRCVFSLGWIIYFCYGVGQFFFLPGVEVAAS